MRKIAALTKIKISLIAVLAMAYVAGLYVPIMNNNAAHHANIALHMYLTGDYLNLVDQGKDYLDKPHLLFWLAALSYKIFGVTSFAYKFFSFLFALVGIYAVYRLGRLVYNEITGRYAALILSSAFAFVLSVNDVRMDAMVVACIAFSTWQLFAYFFQAQNTALYLGALGLALGFATKGMVAIALPVMTTFFYFVQQGRWRYVFTWNWLRLGLLFALFVSPVFYCFYQQFDLHPEKMVRGHAEQSGIFFLVFGQSIQRYTGAGWGSRSSDPFFLVHTFLWAFLPWCLLAYAALVKNLVRWFRGSCRFKETAFAFSATTLLVFVLISFSQFKNAHYVNILFPYFSLLTAHFLVTLTPQFHGIIFWTQLVLAVLLMSAIIALNLWAFPSMNVSLIIGTAFVLLLFLAILFKRNMQVIERTVWLSSAAIALSYFLLNLNFYPRLLPYQSGEAMAKMIRERRIDPARIFYLQNGERNFSMEFYLASLIPAVPADSLKKMNKPLYVFGASAELERLRQEGIAFDTVIQQPHYNVSTLKFRFLRPSTRQAAMVDHFIVKLK